MIAIPTVEPTSLRAGDTWQWRREDLTDYPAPTWTLTYRFKNALSGFEIVAAADGVNFAVTVTAAVSAPLLAGDYDWQAQVVNGTVKHTVDSGEFTVLPNLFAGTAAAALDLRSSAQKIIDAIDAAVAGRASADILEYEIATGNGNLRRLKYCTKDELIRIRGYYASIVASELAAERAALGLPDKRRTYARFARV